jgi:DNA polymerase-3 subunit alpha
VPIGAVMSDFASEDGPARFADNQYITVAGVVNSFRTRTTKNNSLMSYIQFEDDSGAMELIAFQKVLDQSGSLIRDNAALLVRGRISIRDEKEPQLMVDRLQPLEELGAAVPAPEMPREEAPAPAPAAERKLYVKLPSRFDPAMKRIELLLTMFPGSEQMILWCEREKKRIGAKCLIHEGLVLELQEMLGKENVVVK